MKTYFESPDWERAVLHELYRDYHSILMTRDLSLRPAAIALFDSETHWGRWDREIRTISLSRKLIREHSWFDVLGVFRHEIAHQWVDESGDGSPDRGRPHGERFREACRVIGVPEQYSGASAHLQESRLDWREEKRDEASEKLLDKVRKLLALATSNNEHESLLAMNKVRELYAKYNLDQAESLARPRYAHSVICHGKKRFEAHQEKIMGILVGHFFVRVLSFKQFDPKSAQHYQAMEIIGTRENVLMAEYVYHFLLHQTDFLVREAEKISKRKLSRMDRKSYRLGILQGFSDQLARSEQIPTQSSVLEDDDRGSEPSLVGRALVTYREDRHLDSYLAEVYPRTRTRRTASHTVDSQVYLAGQSVGRTITLNKAISASDGSRGRLLADR